MTERSEQPIHDLVATARELDNALDAWELDNARSIGCEPFQQWARDLFADLHRALARIPETFEERAEWSVAWTNRAGETGRTYPCPTEGYARFIAKNNNEHNAPSTAQHRLVLTTPWEDAE